MTQISLVFSFELKLISKKKCIILGIVNEYEMQEGSKLCLNPTNIGCSTTMLSIKFQRTIVYGKKTTHIIKV